MHDRPLLLMAGARVAILAGLGYWLTRPIHPAIRTSPALPVPLRPAPPTTVSSVVTAGPWQRDPAAIYNGPVTIARDTMPPDQWHALLPYLPTTRIDFCDTEDRPYTPCHRQVKTAPDGQSIIITPSYWRNGPRTDFQNRIAYFAIEIPLETRRVTVPLELRDVPLQRETSATTPGAGLPAR